MTMYSIQVYQKLISLHTKTYWMFFGFENCKDCSGVQKKTIQEEGFHTRKGHQQIKNILYPRRRK